MKRRTFCAAATASVAGALPLGRLLAQGAGGRARDLQATLLAGGQGTVRGSEVEDLRSRLRGALLLPGESGYDDARRIWNGAFDRRPALIARCAGAADVREAVTFGREHGLLMAVRGGGHSLSGQSVCDGGLMIDLAPMTSVRVDPLARTARVEPGAQLGALDREALAFGLITPAGTVSHTGVAGLTLGGGFGRLARKYGLTCDNLLEADVVTADGRLLHASARENPDLFWALRGGGGNFGVVTSFQYQLHPFDGRVYGGPVLYPLAKAREALRIYADFQHDAPDDVYADAALITLPGGEKALVFDTCYAGALADGERALAPLRKIGGALEDRIGPVPYHVLQTSGDETFAWGRRYYVKAGFAGRLTPGLVDAMVQAAEAATVPGFGINCAHIGGAASRVPRSDTAFWNRDARGNIIVLARWEDSDATEASMADVRTAFRAIEPHTEGFYVNDLAADDGTKRVLANYGGNTRRLEAIKAKYDPQNVFRLNANVPPAA